MKKALITGVTGQDGSYLAELLLRKGYEVHGIVRRSSSLNRARIDHLLSTDRPDVIEPNPNFHLHYADLSDASSLDHVVNSVRPDEVYNLGAQSHVRVSFDTPIYSCDVGGLGVLRLLDAVRRLSRTKLVKFYQASSSEMFGSAPPPQSIDTPFHPRSPYACAKVFAYHATINYREAYNLFTCNGILFNHESPRRGEGFVTRKITLGATRIKEGLQHELRLGNLDAKRDWGFAGDYVKAMWLMMQQSQPGDYVVATGQMCSVRDFLEKVFCYLDLDYEEYVIFDEKYTRPSEVDALCGDAAPIRNLGWEPEYDVDKLAKFMVDCDWELAKRERHNNGYVSAEGYHVVVG